MKVSRTFWSSHAKSAPVNLWFALSLPPGPSPGSHCCVPQSSTVCSALLPSSPSRAHQSKDFLVISLNSPSLAFVSLLISSNPSARGSSVKWPYKPTSSTSQGPISSPVPSPCLSSLPISVEKPCPSVFLCYPALLPKASALGAGRSLKEFAGASKTSGQDPANSIPGEIGLLGSQDCLLCSQL